MTYTRTLLASFGVAAMAALVFPGDAAAKAKNVVLVHGLNMDASVWRSVRERLTADGFHVSVVQMPMTSIKDDLAAARRVIDAEDGPVVLVGHSYGGMVISQAGTDSKVGALVYVAAFQPEVGESLAQLNASVPAKLPPSAIHVSSDGYYVVEPNAWIADVANGVPPDQAKDTALFQRPANTAIFAYKAEAAAWHETPAWSAIATEDRTIAPELQRQMTRRSGATAVEIHGGHLLPMSNADEVSALIEKAADAVD